MWVNDIIDRIKLGKRNEKGRPQNNERLEFLGDAILDAVVGHIVFRHFEGKREGFLTNTRSKLVSRATLGKISQEMGIPQLIMSAGHSTSHNSYMNGNAFEALVGAIYLDKGYDACMRFMEKRILAQRVKLEFRAQEQKGNDNNSPVFTSQVFLEGLEGCSGTGYSKKESQQNASKETLQRLRREPQFIDSIFAAKADRTKMEEEPVMAAPDIDKIKEENENFIETRGEQPQAKDKKPKSVESVAVPQRQTELDELTLDDITATPREKTREEIIAEAEAAAFEEA